jgi:hypothetical protein
MSTPATVLLTATGVALVALAVRDVFDALLHPEGRGTLGRGLMRAVWAACKAPAMPRGALTLAGPLALALLIAAWAALLSVGWALILWPHLEDGFRLQGPAADDPGFVDALHVSLTTLTTVGTPDASPESQLLRIVAPIEALVGFGLLSASVSYLLLIYPVLARRRSLAYEVWLLHKAEHDDGWAIEELEPGASERLYAELTSRLVAVERDLVNFPIAYYFAERDERFSLPAVAPYMLGLGQRGAREDLSGRVRMRAGLLLEAINDLALTSADRFHGENTGSTEAALAAYARDHSSRTLD